MGKAYITPQDLKEFTMIKEVKEKPDEILERAILIAQMKIDAYCNQNFNTRSEVKELDGSGSNLLVLPERLWKINSVFFDYMDALDSASLSQDKFGLRLKKEMIFNYQRKEGLEEYLPTWRIGVCNITIDGEWGWEEVPEDIKFCTKKLAEGGTLFIGDEDAIKAETGIYESEKIGEYSYKLKDAKTLIETQSTGDSTVDSLLKKYKRSLRRTSLRVGVV